MIGKQYCGTTEGKTLKFEKVKPKGGLRVEKIELKERRWHEIVRGIDQMHSAMCIQD